MFPHTHIHINIKGKFLWITMKIDEAKSLNSCRVLKAFMCLHDIDFQVFFPLLPKSIFFCLSFLNPRLCRSNRRRDGISRLGEKIFFLFFTFYVFYACFLLSHCIKLKELSSRDPSIFVSCLPCKKLACDIVRTKLLFRLVFYWCKMLNPPPLGLKSFLQALIRTLRKKKKIIAERVWLCPQEFNYFPEKWL